MIERGFNLKQLYLAFSRLNLLSCDTLQCSNREKEHFSRDVTVAILICIQCCHGCCQLINTKCCMCYKSSALVLISAERERENEKQELNLLVSDAILRHNLVLQNYSATGTTMNGYEKFSILQHLS